MMLLNKYLTPDIKDQLKDTEAECGFTLDDIIRSGIENPDGAIGVYAGDQSCYQLFSPLFNPIIEDYHHHSLEVRHAQGMSLDKLDSLPQLDPNNQYILSTRVRVGRNVEGYALPPAISTFARAFLESDINVALKALDHEHSGIYYQLDSLSETDREKLIQSHFLFKKGDRFLESAGVNRNWPHHRGIFHNHDKTFLVWVNEEDHLRIISMEKGSDLVSIFKRLVKGIQKIEKYLTFQFDDHLGYLSSCPTNLGTSMRASVHIHLPNLGNSTEFKPLCKNLKLSIRGVHGEHSKSEGNIWDISNKQRLGITETECILTLHQGIKTLIEREKQLEMNA